MKEPLSLGLRWTIRLNAVYAILLSARFILLSPASQGSPLHSWEAKYLLALDSAFLLWLCTALAERRVWARWTALTIYGASALGASALNFMWGQSGADWVIVQHDNSLFSIISWFIEVITPPMALFIVAFLLSNGEEFKN